MSSYKKIPAFSIMEAVVGMVVTAVVMGIVFVIFAIISERMMDFKKQNEYIADMNRLTYSINKDIFDNEKLVRTEDGFQFYSYSGTVIYYKMHADYVLRDKADFIDTFRIPIQQLKMDTLSGREKRVVFQRIEMEVDVNQQPMHLRFFKKIEANELLKKIIE